MLMWFLCGFARRFILNYASETVALTELTKKDKPDKITWNQTAREAFNKVKVMLTFHSILQSPNDELPFILQTDASGVGLGAVLSQEDPTQGDRPVAYFSRKLKDAETRYSAVELECLAAVDAMRHFRVYLLGSEFTLITDNI